MIKKFLIAIICTCFLVGCSPESKTTEISFATWGSVTEVKILKQIIREFESENPEIKINFVHIPQNYFPKIHLLFASNTAPDVIFINNLYLPTYEKYLENLSDYISSKDYYPVALKSMSIDGKLLAVPRDISNQVLYINTDIVQPPSKNWNINDLLKSAQEASKKGVWGINFEEDIYWIKPYLSYYGEILDENFNYNKSEAIRFYNNLRNKYKVAPTKAQIGSLTSAQMFLDEKIAIYLSGRWMYPIITKNAKFNWIIAPFPQGKIPQVCDSSGWALSKTSKNKTSAIKFIQYLSNEKSSKYFTKTGLLVPARISESKYLDNNEHNQKVFLSVLKSSKSYNVPKNYNKLVDKINTNF